MTTFIVLLALCAGAYFFFRHTTRRGANTVRAYFYLRAINAGASVEDANTQAAREVVNGSTETVRVVRAYVQRAYGGKQLPMIEKARQMGMVLSDGHSKTHRASELVPAQDWVEPFVLYYVASEMRLVGEGDLPDTVREMATGRLTGATQQSVLIALQNYLSFAYGRDRQHDALSLAMEEGRDFLQAELRTLNSPIALKRFIRRMHKADTRSDISEAELESQYATAAAEMRADEEFGRSMRNSMLKDSIGELFVNSHDETISSYSHRLEAHVSQSMQP